MPRPQRVCPKPGCPELIPANAKGCPAHMREYEARRGSRQERGYGPEHDRLRAAWQARIDDGEIVYCARGCGTQITGREFDLGHADDRATYNGPECPPCNRADGGRKSHE